MNENINRILGVSRDTGVPVRKIVVFFLLIKNDKCENNELIVSLGVSKVLVNKLKSKFSELLEPTGNYTSLNERGKIFCESLSEYFGDGKNLFGIFSGEKYNSLVAFLTSVSKGRPGARRELDQFFATVETVASRAVLLDFNFDLTGKRVCLLGDDDLLSLAVCFLNNKAMVSVFDIDDKILGYIERVSKENSFSIETKHYDATLPVNKRELGRFDVVFTDPPYTPNGVGLFLSRAIDLLDKRSFSSVIYMCYGTSGASRERFLPIQDIINECGLSVRSVFDAFNRYSGAFSIGASSSLYVLETTPKTKIVVSGNYNEDIYTV